MMRALWLGLVLLLCGLPAGATDTHLATVIADDPVFRPHRLTLTDIPSPTGPAISLFNGQDLADWDIWLGYEDPALTYLPDPARPIGVPVGRDPMFGVAMVDGEPALRVDGRTWGGIVHRGTFGNYHLRLEFKWSGKRHAPRLALPENNGLLYHSHGKPGAVYGTWMQAVEFEIMAGSTGMVVPVGRPVLATTDVGRDASLIDPQRRFMPGGRAVVVAPPAWNVEAATDAERPVGQWNVLDLYVLGDRAIHVVNGVPVMALRTLRSIGPDGIARPLTQGHIQFQSEGAETFFRRLTLSPIDRLPNIQVR